MEALPLENSQFEPNNSIGHKPWYVIMWYLICIHVGHYLGAPRRWYRAWRGPVPEKPSRMLGEEPWYVIYWYLFRINSSYYLRGKWYKDWKEKRAEQKRKAQQ